MADQGTETEERTVRVLSKEKLRVNQRIIALCRLMCLQAETVWRGRHEADAPERHPQSRLATLTSVPFMLLLVCVARFPIICHPSTLNVNDQFL